MADEMNQNVAILALTAALKDNSRQLTAQTKKMIEKVEKDAGTIEFGADTKKIKETINEIVQLLNTSVKGVNFSKQFAPVLEALANMENDASGVVTALANMKTEIDRIAGLSAKSLDILPKLDDKQTQKVFKKYEDLLNQLAEYEKRTKASRESVLAVESRDLTTLRRSYAKNDAYKDARGADALKTLSEKIGVDISNAQAKKSVDEYSQLLTIFELLTKEKAQYASGSTKDLEKNIQLNKELLTVLEYIERKEASLASSYGAKNLSSSELPGGGKGNITRTNVQLANKYATKDNEGMAISEKQVVATMNKYIGELGQESAKKLAQVSGQAVESATKVLAKSAEKQKGATTQITTGMGNVENASVEATEQVENLGEALDGTAGDSQGSGDGLDLWAKSAENLKEKFADVIKYAVDAETALARINELMDKQNPLKGNTALSRDEKVELLGYIQRLGALDGETTQEMDKFFNANKSHPGFVSIKDKIWDMTEAQLEEIERLKSLQSDSSGGAGGDGAFQESSEDVTELTKRVEALETTISEMQTQLTSLNGDAFQKMQEDISGVKQELEETVKKLKELKALSNNDAEEKLAKEGLSKESGNALLQMASSQLNFLDTVTTYHEKVKETNAYLQKGNDIIEERAILMKNGLQVGDEYVMSDTTGKVNIGNGIQKYGADSVLHTHAFSDTVNNLRFSDADIQELVDGTVKKAILLCGDEIATLDMTGVDSSKFEALKDDILGAYTAVFARFGTEVKDGKLVGIDTLPPEVQNQATDIVNNLIRNIMQNYGGDLYFDKLTPDKDFESNDDIRLPKIDASEMAVVQQYIEAIASNNPVKNVIELQKKFGVLKSELKEVEQQAKETSTALSSSDQTEVLSGTDTTIIELDKLEQKLEDVESQADETKSKIISILDYQKNQSDEIDTDSYLDKMQHEMSIYDNDELEESTNYAQRLLDLVHRIGEINSGIENPPIDNSREIVDQIIKENPRQKEFEEKLLAEYTKKYEDWVYSNSFKNVEDILKLYPELEPYKNVLFEEQDFDFMDEFMEYTETLPKAHTYMQWLTGSFAEFIAQDEKVNSSNLIKYFDQDLNSLNKELQEATGKSENFVEKYKGIFDAFRSGELDYTDTMRTVLEKEFPEFNIYEVFGGFQLLPKTKKDFEGVSEEIEQAEAKIISFSDRYKEISQPQVNQTPLSLYEDESGQLAMFEDIATQQQKVEESIKETSQAIEGQIDLFQHLSTLQVQDSSAPVAEGIKEETAAIEENTEALKENANAQKQQNEEKAKAKEVVTNPSKAGFKPPQEWTKDVNKAWKQALQEDNRRTGKATLERYTNLFNVLSSEEGKVEAYYVQLKELGKVLEQLNQLVPINIADKNQEDKLANLSKQIKEIVQDLGDAKYNLAEQVKIDQLSGQISNVINKNTAMPKDMKRQFEELREQLRRTGLSANEVKKISDEFIRLKAQMLETGKTGASLADRIGKKFKDMAAYFATYVSIYDLINTVKQAYQYVAEIDKQMIELEKVSDMSSARLAQSFENATVAAKDLGATISDVISATADWSRLGYDADAAEELARVAILYKNVGDGIDIDAANESLISTLQGFQLDASEAESVVDKFNEVANNYAIDSAGIGEALKRSASSFNAAHTDLSKSIALITATDEVLQNSESTGTLWKTMSARIRGASTELDELGEETDEYTESTSKLRDLIQGLTGFDIMEDEDTFKDIYDIILGIGQEWDNLTDVEQASLGEALAGKRNANGLYAVLDNLDTLQAAYETAENSAGSAMREQEKWEQGLEARTNKLKASLEELSTTFLDSEFLGGAIDAGRTLIEILTSIIDYAGVIPTLLAGGGLAFGIKTAATGGGIFKELINLGDSINAVKQVSDTISGSTAQVQGFAASIQGLSTQQAILAMNTANVSPALMTEALVANGVEREAAEAAVAHAGLSASQDNATRSTATLSAAFQGLKASIGTTGLVIAGIVAAVAAVTVAVAAYNKAKENVRKTSIASTDVYTKESKSLDSQINKYKELKESLDSGTLSASEALEVKEQLYDIQQSLIGTYGDEASNLDLVNGKYADQLELLNEISKEKATQYVNENREAYADAKAALEKQRTYSLGYVMQWNGVINDKNQLLYDFLDNYSDFFDLGKHTVTGRGVTSSVVSLDVKADVETAQDLLHQFAIDLEQFGQKNNIDVSSILKSVSGQLSGIWTEEFEEYKRIYNEFINAEIMRNDSLRPLYKNSIAAVEEYNKALSSGEGVTEALIKVNNLKATVEAATQGNIEYREAWEAIWDAINSKNEEKYNLKTRLSNDGGLMQYIYQLKDLYAVDLRGMNFTDGVTAQEAAFHNLLGVLGYTKENAEIVITTLEELGLILSKPIDIENGITSAFSISDAQAKALSDYQSKIDSIGESLVDVTNLSSSDITSLMIDFKDNAQAMQIFEDFGVTGEQGVGDLEGALRALAELMRKLTVDECPQLKDAINAIFDETFANSGVKVFEKIQNVYDAQLADFDRQAKLIETQLAIAKAKGYLAVQGYYKQLSSNENLQLTDLKNKRDALTEALTATGLTSGEEFDKLQDEIDDVTIAIAESEKALVEFENAMRDIDWEIFDFNREQAQRTMGESDFLLDLLDAKKLIDDMGEFTKEGMASVGLHNLNYNGYMEESVKYAEELVDLEKQMADAPDDTNLINRYNEILEKRQEMILAAEGEKEAIADLVRESYEAQKNALQELIDEYTEALDAEKNLYDQQKKTADQTKRIAELRKMIASAAGDGSEETRAQVQKWQLELDEANSDLESDQWDQYIADQKDILNSIMEEYSEVLDTQSEDTERLFNEAIAQEKLNTENITSTVEKAAEDVGYDFETGIPELLTGLSTSIADSVKQIDNSQTGLDIANLKNNTTTVNSYLDDIKKNTGDTKTSIDALTEAVGSEFENTQKKTDEATITLSNEQKAKAQLLQLDHDRLDAQVAKNLETITTSTGTVLTKIDSVMSNLTLPSVPNIGNRFLSTGVNTILNSAIEAANAKQNPTTTTTNNVGDVNVTIETRAKDARELLLDLQKDNKFKAVMIDTISESLGTSSALGVYRH